MIDSTGVCYIVRSRTPLGKDELQWHLTANFRTVQEIARELAARNYVTIGYTNAIGMFDLDDRLMQYEGLQEGDLAIAGPIAAALMPKEIWKFANAKPKPTDREMAEMAEIAAKILIAPVSEFQGLKQDPRGNTSRKEEKQNANVS